MRLLACVICFMALGLSMDGQSAKDVAMHHLSGMVVEENGQPLAEARIEHGGQKPGQRHNPQAGVTDAAGRFSVDLYSPAIVIRKQGYKSVWMRVQDGEGIGVQGVRVRLESLAKSGQSFPVCAGAPLTGKQRFDLRFKMPESRQLKMSAGADVDYTTQIYRLKGVHGKYYLAHASGPTWSFGIPLENQVWDSVSYEERVSSIQQIPVLDAHGRLANGKRWRLLAIFGETLGYDDANEAAAAAFDAILDQTCFQLAHDD